VIEDPKEWSEIRIGMQGALQNLVLPEPNASAYGRGGVTTPVVPLPPPATQPFGVPPGPGSD
jgi:hypothetical protein